MAINPGGIFDDAAPMVPNRVAELEAALRQLRDQLAEAQAALHEAAVAFVDTETETELFPSRALIHRKQRIGLFTIGDY